MFNKVKRSVAQAFPTELHTSVSELLAAYPDITILFSSEDIALDGEIIQLPYRVISKQYDMSILDDTQKYIYYCVLSRNSDGFLREVAMHHLIHATNHVWVVPYIFHALEDYVDNISLLAVKVDPELIPALKKFIKENPDRYKCALARTISYWNEYYRNDWHSYSEYPPYAFLKKLDQG
jgi:hypothetical protein